MTSIKGIFILTMAFTLLSACSNEPCSAETLKEKTNILMQKLPLLAVVDKEKLAKIGSKAIDLQHMEKGSMEDQCELVDELLNEVESVLE